jgi:nicotinamide-nucleotide amidase
MINKDVIERCAQLLIDKKLTIAFAESATAGRICAEFALPEHAGLFLKGGLNCYDGTIKETLLKVDPKEIEHYTPESAEITCAMAKGLESLIPADLHVSCTGLTCPGGSETEEKPVGTIFLHAEFRGTTLFSDRMVFKGSPEDVILQAVERTAILLLAYLDRQIS